MDNLGDIVILYVVLLISLVVHEAAHALFALWGGDRTAYVGGQVTLNPIPHIQREPFGTVILPIIALVVSGGRMCFGYASTPIDPHWAHRHPRRAALMSAAGPLANFLLAALAFGVLETMVLTDAADPWPDRQLGIPISLTEPDELLYATARISYVFLLLNLLLGVFNLIPWPPLDGAGVLEGLFPRKMRPFYAWVRSQPFVPLIGFVVIIAYVIPKVFWPILYAVIDWL